MSILAVATLMTACGESTVRDEAASATRDDAASATSVQLLALGERISGSPVEKSASEFLANQAVDVGLHACMAAVDMPYPIRYLDESIGTHSTSLGESWAFPLQDDTVLWNLQVAAEKYPQLEEMENGPPKGAVQYTDAYGQALAACEKDVKWPGSEFGKPKGRDVLAFELYQLVTSTEATFGKVDEYDQCMADAGYDVRYPAEDFSGTAGLGQLLWDRRPDWKDIPEIGAEGGPAWDEYQAWANGALDADAGCREANHYKTLTALAPSLTEFEVNNARALEELDSAWDAIVSEARDAGWVDQTQKYTTPSS